MVPLRSPTIVTGPNDGGKSSLLLALRFLLTGSTIKAEDFTLTNADEAPECGAESGRFAECRVEGSFALTPSEQERLGLPALAVFRRTVSLSGSKSFQVRLVVPKDPRLRDFKDKNLNELRERSGALNVEPEGPANRRDSFLQPLQRLAESAETEEAWVAAPRDAEDGLPRLIFFSSTDEPSPEGEIKQALREAYDRALEDPSIIGPVREAEGEVRRVVQQEADQLTGHIVERCPELAEFRVAPQVSFKEGFTGVSLSSSRPDQPHVGLGASGAGTRRRVTLAIWEWTQGLLEKEEENARSVVIAYDEPDTHLDYAHQRDLADLIRRQSRLEGVAVVVATHSLNLIDKVAIQNIVHLDLADNRTQMKQLFSNESGDTDAFLVDIASSMGLRNSVLLHERCFVGVEGATEVQALPILFQIAIGMSLQAAGIALVPAGGNAGARAFCEYFVAHGRTVRFVVDRDSASQRVFSEEKLKAAGIPTDHMFLVGEPDEIEDVFDDALWARAANENWPRSDGKAWEPNQFAQVRGSGKFSKVLFRLVGEASDQAPDSKSALLPTLARSLKAEDEIPNCLRDIFAELIRLADAR